MGRSLLLHSAGLNANHVSKIQLAQKQAPLTVKCAWGLRQKQLAKPILPIGVSMWYRYTTSTLVETAQWRAKHRVGIQQPSA